MCGGIPNSSTLGPKPPRMTIWEALAEIWRDIRKAYAYVQAPQGPDTRPLRTSEEK